MQKGKAAGIDAVARTMLPVPSSLKLRTITCMIVYYYFYCEGSINYVYKLFLNHSIKWYDKPSSLSVKSKYM